MRGGGIKLCVIPARGGSQRIPRKNIKDFLGKPIIAYSIETALKSGCFDQVIVSTDDEEIAKISRQYGAEIPFIRPAELSDAFAGTLAVIKHAIEWFEAQGMQVDWVCCLYATAPFVSAENLVLSYKKMRVKKQEIGHIEYCFSAAKYDSPVQRAFGITPNGGVKMLFPEQFNMRSQDLDNIYFDAGQFYWGTATAFLKELPTFGDYAIPFVLPKMSVQDIDTIEDWTFAEFLYQRIHTQQDIV